jgi:murein DD-endopeptidase MepM/ murein hydrolase activator NlpD
LPAPVKTIDDGTYIITSAIGNRVLDCDDSHSGNGAKVQTWQRHGGANQQVRVTYLNNGYYRLEFVHSGQAFDAANTGNAIANVAVHPYHGGNNQQWEIRSIGGGQYSLVVRHSRAFLDVQGGRDANGTNMITYPSNGTNAQKFSFTRVAQAPPANVSIPAWVTTANAPLNVRSGAGEGHPFVAGGGFNSGQEITVTSNTPTNGFYPVRGTSRTAGEVTGWSSAQFISFDKPRGPVWPVGGNGGSDFRNWPRYNTRNEYHAGTDIAAPTGTPVFSAYDGTVDLVANMGNSSYGRYVIIRSTINGNVRYIYYAHLNRNDFVRVGQSVTAGQQIGTVGSTGNSTGAHLHYEVRDANKRYGTLSSPGLNPHHFLPPR